MKPPAFDYVAPTSLDGALGALRTPGAVVLAGGQSLVLELVYRDQAPGLVVDINRVPGLGELQDGPAGLFVGALVRHAELEREEGGSPVRRLLSRIAPYVAHPPIRHRGTFCGSVAWAHPAAEWNAVALAFDAEVLLRSATGSRQVAAADWYAGDRVTARRPDELVTGVRLGAVPAGTGTGFAEHRRTHASFADVAVVCAVTAEAGTLTQVRLAVAGLGDRPLRLSGVEQAVTGTRLDEVAAEVRRRAEETDLPGNPHQRAVAAVLAGRTAAQAAAGGDPVRVRLSVNGQPYAVEVEPRRLLVDVLRDHLGLTGTNVGCGHGVCGSCTVLVDGQTQRSCLVLGVQCDGAEVRTVEGLAEPDGELHPLQQAFHEHHALQCGFCTPGFLMLLSGALAEDPDLDADPERLTATLASNLCRCTGYVQIRAAAVAAAAALREQTTE